MSSTQPTVSCERCQKTFKTVSSRNRHFRDTHHDNSHDSRKASRIICPCCPKESALHFPSFEYLRDHLTGVHGIKFNIQNLKFDNEKQFSDWKESIEKKNKSFYSLNSTAESTSSKVFYYECHRSNLGKFESECKTRAPKVSGSIKMNGVCPSRIRAEMHQDTSKFSVTYVSTHVGHKTELRRQPLTEKEKNEVVEQIRMGISYDNILKKYRSIESDNCTRLNLITMKDLHYIAESNNLTGKRNKSDVVAVEIKVAEWNAGERKNAFIFKKCGEAHEKLDPNDFVLAYMNSEMEYMLKTYGQRIICMDGTHGTNPYKFELTTILVLDDQHIGYPVVFLISNRKDEVVQEVLLDELKIKVGTIIPEYFMTDDTTIYSNAWTKVMGALPNKLVCTWHIKKNWTIQGRRKIRDKENRERIKKDLNKLLRETDEKEFWRLQQELINYLQKEEDEFLKYLNTYYFKTKERIASWAHCYRRHAGINTNMHLESLHRTLKYKYFCGKTVRRLETCLDALDRFINDKSWSRITSVLRPTATHRDLLVNKYHKKAMDMSFENVAEVSPEKYLVHSQSAIEFYEVDLVDALCNCRTLRCLICDVCVHRFKCSCYEASIKNNFCKHIHLVVMYIKNITQVTNPNSDNPGAAEQEEQKLPEVNNKLLEEVNLRILGNSATHGSSLDCAEKKEQCTQLFNSILEQCFNNSDYSNVINTLTELKCKIMKSNLPKTSSSTKRKMEKQTFFPLKKTKQ